MAKILFNFDMKLDSSCDNWDNQRVFGIWERPPLKIYLITRNEKPN